MKGTCEYRIFRNLEPAALIGEINALPNLFMASLREEENCLRVLVCDAAYWNAVDGSPSDEDGDIHPNYSVIYEIVFQDYTAYSRCGNIPKDGAQRYRVFSESPYLDYLASCNIKEQNTHYSFQFEHQVVDIASKKAPKIIKYKRNERFDKDAEELIYQDY